MKEFLTILTAMLVTIAAMMWVTPYWLTAFMEWILCAAVILWFLPNVVFA